MGTKFQKLKSSVLHITDQGREFRVFLKYLDYKKSELGLAQLAFLHHISADPSDLLIENESSHYFYRVCDVDRVFRWNLENLFPRFFIEDLNDRLVCTLL